MAAGQSLQTGFVLHQRPYRESSAISELFTLEEGRVTVVARAVRGTGRKGRSQYLEPFRPYMLAWSGRSEMHSLRSAESLAPAHALKGDYLFAAMYVNELLIRLCTRHDPHPRIYEAYSRLLAQLEDRPESLDIVLRYFERDLLMEIGYGLSLEFEAVSGALIEPQLRYRYHPEQGASLITDSQTGVTGATLLALARGELSGDIQRREARQLLRMVLNNLLAGQPLKSLQTLKRMKQMRRTVSD